MNGLSQTSKSHRAGPPHHPGLRELVAEKRRWSSPSKKEDALRGFRGWHERGYLPHRDEPGLTEGYWDTFMRNQEHEARTRRYIEKNPSKAFLVRDPREWPWSSARLRDGYERPLW